MKKLLLLTLWIFCLSSLPAQEKGVLRGEVFDTNGLLPGVEISVEGVNMRVSTDADGAFAVKLPPGTYNLSFFFPGYGRENTTATVRENKIKDIEVEMFSVPTPKSELPTSGNDSIDFSSATRMLSFLKKFVFRVP